MRELISRRGGEEWRGYMETLEAHGLYNTGSDASCGAPPISFCTMSIICSRNLGTQIYERLQIWGRIRRSVCNDIEWLKWCWRYRLYVLFGIWRMDEQCGRGIFWPIWTHRRNTQWSHFSRCRVHDEWRLVKRYFRGKRQRACISFFNNIGCTLVNIFEREEEIRVGLNGLCVGFTSFRTNQNSGSIFFDFP
jgi:hypothetical protein